MKVAFVTKTAKSVLSECSAACTEGETLACAVPEAGWHARRSTGQRVPVGLPQPEAAQPREACHAAQDHRRRGGLPHVHVDALRILQCVL